MELYTGQSVVPTGRHRAAAQQLIGYIDEVFEQVGETEPFALYQAACSFTYAEIPDDSPAPRLMQVRLARSDRQEESDYVRVFRVIPEQVVAPAGIVTPVAGIQFGGRGSSHYDAVVAAPEAAWHEGPYGAVDTRLFRQEAKLYDLRQVSGIRAVRMRGLQPIKPPATILGARPE